jgi:hypothetical protein
MNTIQVAGGNFQEKVCGRVTGRDSAIPMVLKAWRRFDRGFAKVVFTHANTSIWFDQPSDRRANPMGAQNLKKQHCIFHAACILLCAFSENSEHRWFLMKV